MCSTGFLLLLSIFYSLFVPALDAGIGAAIFWCTLVALLTLRLRKSGNWRGAADWMNSAFALGLAFMPAVVTNELSLGVATVTLIAFMAMLLIRLGAPGCVLTLGTLPALYGALLLQSVERTVGGTLDSLRFRWLKVSTSTLRGLFLAIPALMLFHVLFASANEAYRHTVTSFVQFILSSAILDHTIRAWITFIILRGILGFSLEEAAYPKVEVDRDRMVTISILPQLGIFAIFSLFQLTAVANALDLNTFRDLSLYVQKGFWQLLVAGVIGFTLWLGAHRIGADVNRRITVSQVLLTFSFLILCISFFTAHKIGLLQWSFGFKDQRVFATLAVILLIAASSLSALVVCRTVSSSRAIHLFLSATLGSVCFLGWVNIDLQAATMNPIRYYVDEKPVRDLSYLLGNSFDNVERWEELMTEGIRDGIKVDPTYYWGHYKPLCTRSYDGTKMQHLTHWHNHLLLKYSAEISSPHQIGAFNLREYRAYRWLINHRELTERFEQVVGESC